MSPKSSSPNLGRWLIVVIYALAMAWVEAAVVYYLRSHIDRIEPYQALPLPHAGGFGMAEFIREIATLVMLLTVGVLAGKTWRARAGFTLLAFGVWDIFYHVFLKVMCGWSNSLLDWDILFLVPLPWWRPVLAPALVSVLMIAWGTLASQSEPPVSKPTNWKVWLLNLTGVGLALYVFMAEALRVAGGGVGALRHLLPEQFNWPMFLIALALMSAPVVRLLLLLRPNKPPLPAMQTVAD